MSKLFPPRLRGTHAVRALSTPALFALALFASHGCLPAREPLRVQWPTMGTIAAVQCVDHASAPRVRDITQSVFDDLNRELSVWSTVSAISAINQAAGTSEALPVSPHFETVLRFALSVSRESDGAFNPLIGPVMRVWGFNGSTPRSEPPTTAELSAAVARTDWRTVEITSLTNGAAVRLPTAGMSLDLGAIAKGYAVDLAWDRLCAAGYTNLLIDLGGNLRAIGESAHERRGWRTGVRNPFAQGALVGSFLLGNGEAVATSGNYERFVEIEGIRYAHIMDSRSGKPVTGMAGTTVVAPTAMLADALSTTLFVLGPEKGAELLRRHPGCEALWIPDDPDHPTLVATTGLAARLSLFKPQEGAPAFALKTVPVPLPTNTSERLP